MKKLSENQFEEIAKVLGEYTTGPKIDSDFHKLKIVDNSGQSTKWRRLCWVFSYYQSVDGGPSIMIDFIKIMLDPARYVKEQDKFETARAELNPILAFAGLEYTNEGEFIRRSEVAKTIDEAHQRAKTLKNKLARRTIHPDVLRFCEPELLQDNYFHAALEACKGLAQKIRDLSGVDGDSNKLVDAVFLGDKPKLAVNELRTEMDWLEQKGFAALLKGCFSAVRNPPAHQPKIMWKGEEDDTVDYLSLISFLHRRLDDKCYKTRW